MSFTGEQLDLLSVVSIRREAVPQVGAGDSQQIEANRRRLAEERLGTRAEYVPNIGYVAIMGSDTEQA